MKRHELAAEASHNRSRYALLMYPPGLVEYYGLPWKLRTGHRLQPVGRGQSSHVYRLRRVPGIWHLYQCHMLTPSGSMAGIAGDQFL